ncbi:MAG: adenine deaminase [Ferruginibacter sp.]
MAVYSGNIVDIFNEEIYNGKLTVENGKVSSIEKVSDKEVEGAPYIMPGFVDSHVHIESSLLIPSEFARMAVVHGTVATISDPHEIANVCGLKGVEFMIENGKTVPFKFHFGAPSCVPATIFETAGDELNSDDVDKLLQMPEIFYLSEMMNFPGVINGDEEVLKKIASSHKYNKPVDGHAPGLRGADAKKYIDAGISTDHECFTEDEAAEKLKYGMKILIREGSAAKNFEALVNLINDNYKEMMFCSDDKHPDSLLAGHINSLCARAIAKGISLFKILNVACINPVLHYKMDVGLLRKGDSADFIMVDNIKDFKVLKTFIDGNMVASDGKTHIESTTCIPLNKFDRNSTKPEDFIVKFNDKEINVIGALDGQLITENIIYNPKVIDGNVVSNVEDDILKIAVVNRYSNAPVAISFIKNFGLKSGALASSVAHDSHNIVVVGISDDDICKAVNLVIKNKGGLVAVGSREIELPLPVAGLMSDKDGYEIAAAYTLLDKFVKQELGSTLSAPFMTLSFMALLVIPHLKLSDKGLFNGDTFSFIN